MTSVNVTTQSNTVTVQQGDATTVTIATQGPQGPAGVGSSNVVDDTSPQLGGDLQSNGNDIDFADNDKAIFGTGSDLHIFHNANGSFISHEPTSSKLFIQTNSSAGIEINKGQSENIAKFIPDGAVELYHNNVKKVETSADGLDLPDNTKLQLGDNQDLQLFHTGSLSEIKNLNVNVFTIRQAFTNGFMFIHADRLQLRSHSTNESYITCTNNGSVELYHDNVKKIETSANGVDVTGTVDLSSAEANASNTAQFKLSNLTIGQHNNIGSYRFANAGTGSFLLTADNINFFNKDVNKSFLRLSASAVELYHDNVKKAETSATGFSVTGSITASTGATFGGTATFASDGYLTTTSGITIENTQPGIIFSDTSANPDYIIQNRDGSFAIRDLTNAANRFLIDTANGNITATGNINLPDNSKLQFGNSQDLEIYHSGNHSFIRDTGTGNLYIDSNQINFRGALGEQLATFTENGSAELYHNNVKKLETTNSGITVTGSVTTQDMNMSNLNGTANEVDNTKGSWSIQEGADDLFLINRVSGKKYKFNLTEIS